MPSFSRDWLFYWRCWQVGLL